MKILPFMIISSGANLKIETNSNRICSLRSQCSWLFFRHCLSSSKFTKMDFGHLHITQRLVSFDQVEWMKCCAKNIELGYSIYLLYYALLSLMFSAQFHCHLVCKMESVDKVWVAAALSAKKKKEFVSLPLLRFFFLFCNPSKKWIRKRR